MSGFLLNSYAFQSAPTFVSYSGISASKGEVSSAITIPTIQSNQMVVFMERAQTFTPPALRSGFTNILTVSNTSINRSLRLQYRIGGNSESITTATSASYFVINNATTVGVSATTGAVSGSGTTITFPALSGATANGQSLVYAVSYFPTPITAISSPYTVIAGVGGYIEQLQTTSVASGTFTKSELSFTVTAVVEFRL